MNVMSPNKTVVITGAASGIGKAAALKYHEKGYQVIGLDRHPADAPYPILYCDIVQDESVRLAFEQIRQCWGSIHYLINCAGVFFSGNRAPIEQMDLEDWNNVLQINLTGTMLVTKNAIPLLKEASGDRGIVNVSSDQATYPRSRNGAYAVSKSGIECLTRLCATELLNDKIRVNAVAPASVRSNVISELAGSQEKMDAMYRKQDENMPLGLIEAEEIAETILFLGSESATKITGQILSVDSGSYLKG